MRRLLALLAVAALVALAVATPVLAAADGPRHREAHLSFHGGIDVAKDERVDGFVASLDGPVLIAGFVDGDVYVVRGNLHITGRVHDDVLVIRGDVIVDGGVDGDIVVVGGRAIVRGDAFVQGSIKSSDQPRISKQAQITGSVEKLELGGIFSGLLITLLAFIWLAVTASSAVLGALYVLVFPRAADAVVAAGRRTGVAIATGISIGFVGPIAAVVTVASLVGLPFGFGLLGALMAISGLGYVSAALCLGRLMVKGTGTRGRIGAFFAGLGILRFAALVPVIGALVGFGAAVFGVGAIGVAAWRASRGEAATPAATSDVDEPAEAE